MDVAQASHARPSQAIMQNMHEHLERYKNLIFEKMHEPDISIRRQAWAPDLSIRRQARAR